MPSPTFPCFGVDSYSAIDSPVVVPRAFWRAGESGHVREPLYDYVVRRAGREPCFWGRYVNGSGQGSDLTLREVNWLASWHPQCRIVLIYNGVGPSGERTRRASGESAAREAIRIATDELDAPDGARIYIDLEGWLATPEYLDGWFTTMYGSRFAGAGGVYGRGVEMIAREAGYRLFGLRRSSGWAARMPRAEDVGAQQRFDDLIGSLTGQRPRAKPFSPFVWTNTPRVWDRSGDTPGNAVIIPPAWGGRGPVGVMLTDTVLWQYRFEAFWSASAHRGSVDLDLALEAAYRDMWQPLQRR
jgi:hypothetical protein